MKRVAIPLVFGVLAACSQASDLPTEAVPVLAEAETPTAFTRAYGLTESMDGMVRVFAREQGDRTLLYEMRKQEDGSWSAPVQLDFPHRIKLTNPSFSFADGMLYYSSDADILERGQRDGNIWRVELMEDGWGTPEHLPASINTGAEELNPAMDSRGRLYFTSNGYDSVGGHDIFQAIEDDESGEWKISGMPDGFNHARADAHLAITPDGGRIFFYSHRKPKLGVVDIWTATRTEDGTWGTPRNLGAPVNTPGIDFGPGISSDGGILFFSREGELMMISLEAALEGVGTVSEN
ncbi:sialidase family protein [Henriciella sp.]|uniref:sialidase family protein n=1 Tax=Henriciella sp. TaxID=1968823 RepID=UPI00260AF6D7|nr:sialidase family protein [Henriciella sp.]